MAGLRQPGGGRPGRGRRQGGPSLHPHRAGGRRCVHARHRLGAVPEHLAPGLRHDGGDAPPRRPRLHRHRSGCRSRRRDRRDGRGCWRVPRCDGARRPAHRRAGDDADRGRGRPQVGDACDRRRVRGEGGWPGVADLRRRDRAAGDGAVDGVDRDRHRRAGVDDGDGGERGERRRADRGGGRRGALLLDRRNQPSGGRTPRA